MLSQLGLTVNNFCFHFILLLWLYDFVSYQSGVVESEYTETGTIINLSSHHFQPFCSKDENVIFCFIDCNHIFVWRLILLIACVTEPRSGTKVSEYFFFKPLYNLHNSFSYSHYKGRSNEFFGIFNNVVGDLKVIS